MVFRLCLCVVLLYACGYATKSTDYCKVLVNYDTFKTSVDNFLASRDETCGNSDVRSERKETCLDAVDNRINDLEKEVVKLLRDNEYKEIRLSYLETEIANLTSELSVDCGSPTPIEGTDVVYESRGLLAIANYTCRKGLLNISPRDTVMSVCQKDRSWTKVIMKCVNISGCGVVSDPRVLYTGTQSTTRSGKTCQRWDAQEPHSHDKTKDAKFAVPGFYTPQTVTGSANYCRDPARDGFLWCYTTNPAARWEKCDVPICPN
ncbi:uncharacterized protein LOC124126662 [Haliotis rufescens]|uniref:uncharacterized protein LOC124126662 n=1 Tax=Haliotis rufescens TaxID=6454 RepID=UPI00201F8EF9|nr:uncharacterized protein LOC124126662 [Haliotis rufescens]